MSTLTWPSSIKPSKCTFSLRTNTQAFQSPLSRTVQTLEHPGARWHAVMQFSLGRSSLTSARAFAAFLVRLRGASGRFYLGDFGHPDNLGTCPGTPVVNGADQTGNTLATSGWTASQSGILLAGDYIQIGDKLKMVVIDADSDADGLATLTIEPPIEAGDAPADAASIVTSSPMGVFRLIDDEQAAWAISKNLRHSFTLEAEEVLV